MNISIDCVGEICPVPVVKAKIQYKRLKINESITIVTDHSCTSQGLKDAFKKYDCDMKIEEYGGIWDITITKLS